MATNTTKSSDPATEPRPRPEAPKHVSCEACMQQLTREDAYRSESEDYVLWFCGTDCYSTWQQEDVGDAVKKDDEERQEEQAKSPPS